MSKCLSLAVFELELNQISSVLCALDWVQLKYLITTVFQAIDVKFHLMTMLWNSDNTRVSEQLEVVCVVVMAYIEGIYCIRHVLRVRLTGEERRWVFQRHQSWHDACIRWSLLTLITVVSVEWCCRYPVEVGLSEPLLQNNFTMS